jgi:glycosyltransferase involved in cell wall biosynthesis
MTEKPFISVVLPFKRGITYLKEAVGSLIQQDSPDWELIVLADNTSNEDGSIDWLQSLQLPNLRIEQSQDQLDINQNWSRITSLEKKEFLTILGYDDILYSNYLSEVKELIRKNPDASLYQTHFDFINSSGNNAGKSPPMKSQYSLPEFARGLLDASIFVMATGYVMKSKDYDESGGIPVQYPNLLYADYELWLSLVKKSYLAVSGRTCFAFRIHQSTTKVSSERKLLKGFEHLINYFENIGKEKEMKELYIKEGSYFLQYHCNDMIYRLIRKKHQFREGLTVKEILTNFNTFAAQIGVNPLELFNNRSIRIGDLVDRNFITRNFYLLFKKVVAKPVLKPSFNK